MQWPLEHRDVAQPLDQLLDLRRFGGAAGPQQDDRKIRPGGLGGDPVDQRGAVELGKGLLGDDQGRRSSRRPGYRGEIGNHIDCDAGARQDRGDDHAVPSGRRQDQYGVRTAFNRHFRGP